MIEALDLLLEARDRSTKKDVKQVKPTHADVGSEVTAEISSGPYRFVYRKRFHKQCETGLTVLAPRREQLTRRRSPRTGPGDAGRDGGQRAVAGPAGAAVRVDGRGRPLRCDALSRALDVAAGDAAALSGTEPLLIERIDAEYARYFTPTGRPTGEWAAAIIRLAARRRRSTECAAAVAEVDDGCAVTPYSPSEVAELSHCAGRRLAAPSPRRPPTQIAALTRQAREAELVADAAAATSAASAAAHNGRLAAAHRNRRAHSNYRGRRGRGAAKPLMLTRRRAPTPGGRRRVEQATKSLAAQQRVESPGAVERVAGREERTG